MKVLGIYCSPRKGGNTDILLDTALEAAQAQGAEVSRLYCRRHRKVSGCIECGSCEKTGKCVIKDEMQDIYPLLEEADSIIISVPIFFYTAPAQAKLIIDRCQAMWSKRLLTKKSKEERKSFDSGKGYLIAVGATKGANLFQAVELETQYFFDALDMSFEGGLYIRQVEKKAEIRKHPEHLEAAAALGRKAAAV